MPRYSCGTQKHAFPSSFCLAVGSKSSGIYRLLAYTVSLEVYSKLLGIKGVENAMHVYFIFSIVFLFFFLLTVLLWSLACFTLQLSESHFPGHSNISEKTAPGRVFSIKHFWNFYIANSPWLRDESIINLFFKQKGSLLSQRPEILLLNLKTIHNIFSGKKMGQEEQTEIIPKLST